MRSFKKAFKVADEMYTPTCLVKEILPFVSEYCIKNKIKTSDLTIWCPFDTAYSKYVIVLLEAGYNVVHSHISEGNEHKFFWYEPEHWDIAISNPPFSVKLDVFKRLYVFGKPFAMLMNMMAINYQEIGNMFYEMGDDIQFIIPDKKVSFNGKTSSFCSGYVCYKFIEKTKFIHMDNNNSGKFFKE